MSRKRQTLDQFHSGENAKTLILKSTTLIGKLGLYFTKGVLL